MVNKKMLLTNLIAALYFLILSLSVSQAQNVTLTLEDGAGIKGTNCCNPLYPDSNRMELSLENLVDKVGILQVDICSADLGGHLVFSGWEVTPRAGNLTHTITEVTGCIQVRFYWTDGGNIYIAEGSGPVLILYFDVDVLAPGGTCSNLTLSNISITDPVFVPLTVTPIDGQFCYYACIADIHCDDGVFCNGEELCLSGLCVNGPVGPCQQLGLSCNEASDTCFCENSGQCDDGLWCNGAETCSGGNCLNGAPPCTDDGDPCTDDCDEIGDTCQHVCSATGPWDACCQSSSACTGAVLCNEEITVTIGNGEGAPGSSSNPVAVSLNNPADLVKGVLVSICDVDDYLTCTDCAGVGRGEQFTCNVNEVDGCCNVSLVSYGGASIATGSGAVLNVYYDVSGVAPYGQCRDLSIDTGNFSVIDGNTQELVAMPDDGNSKFCFPCTIDAACNDGNDCTDEACVGGLCEYSNNGATSCSDWDGCTDDTCTQADDGDSSVMMCGQQKCDVCLGTDSCPDDGDYCNGVEYCIGSPPCISTGNPCSSQGLTCNGFDDLCDGSDVVLTVENTYGSEGVINVLLDNAVDLVGEVHVDICNVDQRDWLHLSSDGCNTTSRTVGFNCFFSGQCAVGGNQCTTATQWADCTMSCNGTGLPCIVDADCDPGETCDSCDPDFIGNGCVGVDLISSFPLDQIATGSGAILQLNYTTDPVTIPMENYADLNPENMDIKDTGAVSLLVTPRPGKLYVADYCEGDFDCTGTVDAGDITDFLIDFGRSAFFNPCTNLLPCKGDFNCDAGVDAGDTEVLLEDFGRSPFLNPCPPCDSQFDCVY